MIDSIFAVLDDCWSCWHVSLCGASHIYVDIDKNGLMSLLLSAQVPRNFIQEVLWGPSLTSVALEIGFCFCQMPWGNSAHDHFN